MASLNLTQDELLRCQRWFKYIFLPFSKDADTNAAYLERSWDRGDVYRACKRIMQVITDRLFDQQVGGETDQAFDTLSHTSYIVNPNDYPVQTYKVQTSIITKFLAFICLTNHIFWDDGSHSTYEKDYFIQTKLGKALWAANCFLSQQTAILKQAAEDANKEVNTSTGTSATGASQRTRSPNTGASTGTGRTISLQNCGGLVSTTKEVPSAYKMLFIQGEWIQPKKTTPRIYVTPNVAGQTVLKVNLSSGQGFDDCVLYFDDLDKAKEFMSKCGNINPTKVQNLTIRKQTTDPNGYFRVNTEFGEAFIKAARLGE